MSSISFFASAPAPAPPIVIFNNFDFCIFLFLRFTFPPDTSVIFIKVNSFFNTSDRFVRFSLIVLSRIFRNIFL